MHMWKKIELKISKLHYLCNQWAFSHACRGKLVALTLIYNMASKKFFGWVECVDTITLTPCDALDVRYRYHPLARRALSENSAAAADLCWEAIFGDVGHRCVYFRRYRRR